MGPVPAQRDERCDPDDNNQVLHSSVTALMGGAVSEGNAVAFDSVPSSAHLDRALLGAIWCYTQTVTLA